MSSPISAPPAHLPPSPPTSSSGRASILAPLKDTDDRIESDSSDLDGHLGLSADGLADEVDGEDYLSGLQISEDEEFPEEEDEVGPQEEDFAPEDEENPETRVQHDWLSFEDSFFGKDEGSSSKVSFLFSAKEDLIAMGYPVDGKSDFLRETDPNSQVNPEADQGDPEADQGDPEADQRAVQKEKKGSGSRKGGGYEIGSERLSFKFGRFREKKRYKYRAGGRSQRSRCTDQEGKVLMRVARAQLAEELHLEAEATRLEVLLLISKLFEVGIILWYRVSKGAAGKCVALNNENEDVY